MQIYFCRDKRNFVATKVLSRQAYFCCDKHVFCPDKSMLVATNILSGQRRALSRETRVYSDRTFVATKMVLVAAPPTDMVRLPK